MHTVRYIFVGLYLSILVTSVVHAGNQDAGGRNAVASQFNAAGNPQSIDRTTPVNLTRPPLASPVAAPATENGMTNSDDHSAGLTWLAGLVLIACIAIRRMT